MDLLLMAQLVADSVVVFSKALVALTKEVPELPVNVLLLNNKLVLPMPVLLPLVPSKTSKPLLRLNVTRMPVLLLRVKTLLMPLLPELLLTVPPLPASRPTVLILTVTTGPSLTLTRLLLRQVVSTQLPPTVNSPANSAHLLLLPHQADLASHKLSMLLQGTPLSLLLTRLLPHLPVSTSMPETLPLPDNSLPLPWMFLLNLSQGTLPSPMLTELLPLPPLLLPPRHLAELDPQLLEVHLASLVPTPPVSEVSPEPPPLFLSQEDKPLAKPLLDPSVLEPSLPKARVKTKATATAPVLATVAMVAMAHTVDTTRTLSHPTVSPTLSHPTVSPMLSHPTASPTVSPTVDINKDGDQGSVTF